jgi:arsenite-transporting ATPase
VDAPDPDSSWTQFRSRFILFTGKGGVGKTTTAAALAVALSDEGRRVLIVSTDPASNLSGVFTTQVGNTPTPVPGVPGLDAMDIDPQAAADSYRARVLEPLRDTMPAADVDAVAEQLAGQCTVEVAAFDEFSGLLAAPEITAVYDHIIFDTAPTGHTLRLLELPAAWSNFIETSPDGASCLGPLSALGTKRSLYQDTVAALGDPTRTTVVLVARPERTALAEADRAGNELASLGVTNQHLIINGLLTAPLPGDPVAETFSKQQHDAIERLSATLAALPVDIIALVPYDLIGVQSLRSLTGRGSAPPEPIVANAAPIPVQDLDALIADLAEAGPGVVMVMGKGGVGKSTVATAIAHGLAAARCPTHLASTDPAGRLDETPGSNLTTSWIDPRAETQRYIDAKLARAANLDAAARDLLEEDLRSPCTEELAVFVAFSNLLRRGRREHVVIDTAPTGHTLLLLDQTGSYHRDIQRASAGVEGRVTTPLMRLQDPEFTRVLIVTLAQTTPIQEATELQLDLRRAGIEPAGWIINASLAASDTTDPVLMRRAALEHDHIHRVHDELASRVWIIPWQPESATTVRRAWPRENGDSSNARTSPPSAK